MSEQANISLLKQAYDAFDKGDIQRLLGLLAQDIEWELPEVEGIPVHRQAPWPEPGGRLLPRTGRVPGDA